jgi:hypothetical protein
MAVAWFRKEPKRDLRGAFDTIAERIPSMAMEQVETALGEPASRVSVNAAELTRTWNSPGFAVVLSWDKTSKRLAKAEVIDGDYLEALKLRDWLAKKHPKKKA